MKKLILFLTLSVLAPLLMGQSLSPIQVSFGNKLVKEHSPTPHDIEFSVDFKLTNGSSSQIVVLGENLTMADVPVLKAVNLETRIIRHNVCGQADTAFPSPVTVGASQSLVKNLVVRQVGNVVWSWQNNVLLGCVAYKDSSEKLHHRQFVETIEFDSTPIPVNLVKPNGATVELWHFFQVAKLSDWVGRSK